MMLRVLSVCSGIGSDALAWGDLGWTHAAFAEIAPFPSRVLASRFPSVPNLGDMTAITEASLGGATVDLLVGGTPCQSFSSAGLRGGLADARGQLALVYCLLARALRPRWLVWENVPGVLSADGGRAFGTFLGALGELGYGFAYRVLDAQHFGLAQRRKRVFVVACAGADWRRPAAVLFERSSLRGDPVARREAGADLAGALGASSAGGRGHRVGADEAAAGHVVRAHALGGERQDPTADTYVIAQESQSGVALYPMAGTIRSGAPGSQPGGSLVCAFNEAQITSGVNRAAAAPNAAAPTLHRGGPPTAFHVTQDPISGECSPALGRESTAGVVDGAPRRLMPVECERLQGFPDGWTDIPGASDSARYAAIGSAIAVPVLRWIGKRIAEVEAA